MSESRPVFVMSDNGEIFKLFVGITSFLVGRKSSLILLTDMGGMLTAVVVAGLAGEIGGIGDTGELGDVEEIGRLGVREPSCVWLLRVSADMCRGSVFATLHTIDSEYECITYMRIS